MVLRQVPVADQRRDMGIAMALKESIEGYSVIVFVPSTSYYSSRNDPSRARSTANEIAKQIRQHLGSDFEEVNRAIDIEPQVDRSCEHCGSRWTEKSTTYNGGCCDKDENANPDYESCNHCGGTGSVDTPFSGSDPVCPKCDGDGRIHAGSGA